MINGRLTCVFSRLIPVLERQVGEDLDLNNSYYIMLGMGEDAGMCIM